MQNSSQTKNKSFRHLYMSSFICLHNSICVDILTICISRLPYDIVNDFIGWKMSLISRHHNVWLYLIYNCRKVTDLWLPRKTWSAINLALILRWTWIEGLKLRRRLLSFELGLLTQRRHRQHRRQQQPQSVTITTSQDSNNCQLYATGQ